MGGRAVQGRGYPLLPPEPAKNNDAAESWGDRGYFSAIKKAAHLDGLPCRYLLRIACCLMPVPCLYQRPQARVV
jgi:hypothetical protein